MFTTSIAAAPAPTFPTGSTTTLHRPIAPASTTSRGWTRDVWRVYAAFPQASTPRLASVVWGDALIAPNGAGIIIGQRGLANPCDSEVNDGVHWPSGGGLVESFTAGTRTGTIEELYWFYGYGYAGLDPLVDLPTFCTMGWSAEPAVFIDDAPMANYDPIAGFGSMGFGHAGSTPCPAELGACCELAGTCTLVREADCASPSATWHGEWLTCNPDPCVAVEGAEATPETITTLRAEPNPFSGSTTLRLGGPPTTSVRVLILDSAGRLVRTAWEGDLDGREAQITWDGLDDSGRPAPAGTYFAQVETSNGPRAAKVVLLK